MTRFTAVAVALTAIALGACASLAPTPTADVLPSLAEPPSVTVWLGLYSGRPNPAWSLTEGQIAELDRRLTSLPTASGDPAAGGLGYQGFYLNVAATGQASRMILAFRGAIASLETGPRPYWLDPARTVEAYLLDTGRPHLTASEIAVVEDDLSMTR